MSVRANLDRVRSMIDRAMRGRRRDFGPVTLVAVTKTRTAAEVNELLDAGALDLGENRLDAYLEREAAARAARPNLPIRMHFIGSLQRNKAGKLLRASRPALIQSVDSADLARTLSRHASDLRRTVDILIEVKVSPEATKHGASSDDLLLLSSLIGTLPGLALRGVMAMAPLADDRAAVRSAFDRAADLFAELRRVNGATVDTLSLGMSGDFVEAVEAGSTMVRVGSALFA